MIDASSNLEKKEQPDEFYILYLVGLEKLAFFRGYILKFNIYSILNTIIRCSILDYPIPL